MYVVFEHDRLVVSLLDDIQPDIVMAQKTADFSKREIPILVRISELWKLTNSQGVD